MAKRTVPVDDTPVVEPVEQPTYEQIAEWDEDRQREHEEALAPYRAVHAQQNDQDDILAELMFEVDLLKLGLDE